MMMMKIKMAITGTVFKLWGQDFACNRSAQYLKDNTNDNDDNDTDDDDHNDDDDEHDEEDQNGHNWASQQATKS